MTDRGERRQEAALRGIVEVAELATINISRILADKIREQRNAQNNAIPANRQQTNDEHNYAALQAPNGHGQPQNPLESLANMATGLANSRSMNAASGINNGEDSDDEIRFIGIENGPGTSSGSNEKIRLIVDQVVTNNQQIDVQQSPPVLSPATTLETVQQALTPSSSNSIPQSARPIQYKFRPRSKFPDNPIVDQLIIEYAKWSLDNTNKAGALQLLIKSISKVIGEDATKHKYGIETRVRSARKMIKEERSRQQQIHPSNNQMPPSTSSSCSQSAIPESNVRIEQQGHYRAQEQHVAEANENEADEQDQNSHQNEIMEPSEKEDPLMNLMERFEAKFDQNVVRNIDTPTEGDQVEVGYEEVDVNALADRGNLGNEEPQLAENDAETTFTSSMTEGFLDDANDTRVDCEEVQQRQKDLMKEEAEEQSPEKRKEQRPEEEENVENEEERSKENEEERSKENEEEQNIEIGEEKNMENRGEENMENEKEENMENGEGNPQNDNMENASTSSAVEKQLTSPAVDKSLNNLVERMEMDIPPPTMQGAKLLMGKQVAKRRQPFKKPNSQNPGLIRMFNKVPNKSPIVSLIPVLNEETDLIVKKTLLLSIKMNEGKMNSADMKRGIKQEPRSEFDDIAKSMGPDEEEEDVQQADGQSAEPVPKRMAVEPAPPLFRPPPLFKHGRLQIVRVMIDSYGENKKKTLKVNKKSVKKLPTSKSSLPTTSTAALKAKTPKSAIKPPKKRRRLNTPSSIPSTSSAASTLQQSPSRRFLKRGHVNAEAEATDVRIFHDKMTPEWKSRLMFNGSIRCNECDPHSEWSLSGYPSHMLKEHSIFIRETAPVVEYLSTVDAETFQEIVWRCEYCKRDFDTVDEYAAHVEADEEHRAKAPKRKVAKKFSIEHIKQIRDRIFAPNSN